MMSTPSGSVQLRFLAGSSLHDEVVAVAKVRLPFTLPSQLLPLGGACLQFADFIISELNRDGPPVWFEAAGCKVCASYLGLVARNLRRAVPEGDLVGGALDLGCDARDFILVRKGVVKPLHVTLISTFSGSELTRLRVDRFPFYFPEVVCVNNLAVCSSRFFVVTDVGSVTISGSMLTQGRLCFSDGGVFFSQTLDAPEMVLRVFMPGDKAWNIDMLWTRSSSFLMYRRGTFRWQSEFRQISDLCSMDACALGASFPFSYHELRGVNVMDVVPCILQQEVFKMRGVQGGGGVQARLCGRSEAGCLHAICKSVIEVEAQRLGVHRLPPSLNSKIYVDVKRFIARWLDDHQSIVDSIRSVLNKDPDFAPIFSLKRGLFLDRCRRMCSLNSGKGW